VRVLVLPFSRAPQVLVDWLVKRQASAPASVAPPRAVIED